MVNFLGGWLGGSDPNMNKSIYFIIIEPFPYGFNENINAPKSKLDYDVCGI